MRWGQGTVFWVLGIWWLLAYIKTDNRLIQKYYYRAISWGIAFSWLFYVWYTLAFFIGAIQMGGSAWGWNFLYWFLATIFLGGPEILA